MEFPVASPTNPFSTRYVRPSVFRYLFPDGSGAGQLLAALGDTGWWGQIVGPHGSGKSTLLHTLVPRIEQSGRRVAFYTFHDAQRRLGVSRSEASTWDSDTQVVVDGFEQLNWFSRIWLRRACRNGRAGLLVTAHESVGLPTLWTTSTSAHMACRIVAGLLAESRNVGITEKDIHDLFQENRGDVRELLMALYDLYEQRTASVDGM